MQEQPLISVIVPVYRVEQYLDDCVASIVAQSYQNLEIILVDDGSPDHCPDMCDAWADKDSRIRVLHKENGGLSDARNAGFAEVTGTFVGFVDSDDWIAEDMYARLYHSMTETGSDIVSGGICIMDESAGEECLMTPVGNLVLDTESAMIAIIREDLLKQPVWNKLYRREIIESLLFLKGKYHEDCFWSYQAIGNAKQVSIIEDVCYFYRQRPGSIMEEQYSLRRLDAVEAKEARQVYLSKHFPMLSQIGSVELRFFCLYQMQLALRFMDGKDLQTVKQKLVGTVSRNPIVKQHYRNLSVKEKIWLIASNHGFVATGFIRNILKIGM